ncbi:MAG TPA: VCBS repeat-containing protein, partial [Thermoanaerobaculia bacterium]|nr:VCBS repeat-containing protein [Thermoanaerobaculia bacterium]
RLPSLPQSEHDRLVSQFRFARFDLPLPPSTEERKTLRPVHPRLQRINAWISAVGAAIAATDLDGDGLPNDLCYVDNGTNEVVVTPAPGAERYPLFTLSPAPLPYQAATMAPMGCLPGDFNEDGHTDVLVYYWGRTPVVFLRNGSAGPLSAASFERAEISSSGETWYTNAATQADFDGDGHVDLVFGNYFPEGSGVIDAAATSDAEMQRSMSRADNGGKNRLLLWKSAQGGEHPAVAYQEIPGALPGRAEIGWTLAMGAADLDGDQLPELYVANDFGPDVLLHNRSKPGQVSLVKVEGRTGFAIPTSKVLGHDSFKGMGVDFADVNGDGLLDIYISNIASEYSLEESHLVWVSTGRVDDFARGIAPYVDKSEPLGLSRSGWGWDCRFADFNNDGILEAVQATGFLRGEVNKWPELHEVAMGNDQMLHHPWAWPALHPGDDLSGYQHNPFFVRSASGRFFDLAQELGMGQPVVTRAITIADVDGDGDHDIAQPGFIR